MIKIEIREELIDWLEEHADDLSREDCQEFAREFVSFIMMTGALTVEMPGYVYDKGEDEYIVRCIECGVADNLQMVAHRVEDRIVGFIFCCRNCALALYGSKIEIQLDS